MLLWEWWAEKVTPDFPNRGKTGVQQPSRDNKLWLQHVLIFITAELQVSVEGQALTQSSIQKEKKTTYNTDNLNFLHLCLRCSRNPAAHRVSVSHRWPPPTAAERPYRGILHNYEGRLVELCFRSVSNKSYWSYWSWRCGTMFQRWTVISN